MLVIGATTCADTSGKHITPGLEFAMYVQRISTGLALQESHHIEPILRNESQCQTHPRSEHCLVKARRMHDSDG